MVNELTIKIDKLLLSESLDCKIEDIEFKGTGNSRNYRTSTLGWHPYAGRDYKIPSETGWKDSYGRKVTEHLRDNVVSIDPCYLGTGGQYRNWGSESMEYKGFKHACLGEELKHPMDLSYKEAHDLYCWYIGKREEGERDGDLLFHYHQFKEGYDVGLDTIKKHPEFLKK